MIRRDIKSGHVYRVGADCGVPHNFRPIHFRVVSVDPASTWDGMAWLEGYELDRTGQAVARRRIYVIAAGLIDVTDTFPRPARLRPRNAGTATRRLPTDFIGSDR
ncbi:hypothetical protein [Krasilnikovia sp. MM14-A1259]|uniref:hypothetical protein n=1 Tax=Krasilnikovia sp. MM14-A1259 TaxID=3373539 RepID=UPI0037F5B91E